ncbi:MAG: GGDEF domain-containing protein [Treponema sp.]|nr:GGDEF domain-containing protein [Treponema sp.]
MENQRFYRIQDVFSLIIILFLAGLTGYVIWYARDTTNVRLAYDYSQGFNDSWYYLDDSGSKVEIESLPYEIPDSPEEQSIYRDILSPLDQDFYLDFYSHHQELEISVDGQVMYSYYSGPRPSWLASYRSIHHFVKIPKGMSGTIKYKVISQMSTHRGEFHEVVSGDRLSLSWMIIHDRFGKLCLGFVLILMGIFLIGMILTFTTREQIDKALLNLSLMCLAMGLWQIEESRITQLIIGNVAIHWAFEYLVQLAVLIAIYNFIRSITTEQYQLYTNVLFFLVMGSIMGQLLLQLLGIVQLSASIIVTHILFFVCILFGAILVNRRLQFSSKKMKIIFNCSVGFSLLVFFILLVASDTPEYTDSVLNLGLVFMFISLMFLVFQRTAERNESIKKTDLYQKLAFMDLSTGVGSHSAWYSFTEDFKDEGKEERYCLVLFDMNNLKYMNDTFGHLQGDAMIKIFCECLQKSSKKKGSIYRIGGDEFIFICKNETEDWVKEMLHDFEESIKNQKETNVAFSAAYGYAFFVPHNKNDFYEAQNKADSQMYRMKREMKIKNPFKGL